MIIEHIPKWLLNWSYPTQIAFKFIAIIGIAWLMRWLVWSSVRRLGIRYHLPLTILVPLRNIIGWLIVFAAVLAVMQIFGVSASVLWTAFTGFTAMAAIAFFAAWSVLSNMFCSFLILFSAPFRIGDSLEILDATDKPGVKGRVLEIKLLHTVLEDLTNEKTKGAILKLPNAAFFQKTIRCWPAKKDDPATFDWH